MALTRNALAQLLVTQIGLNGREAHEMIERFYGEIASTLEAGENVELAEFGEFAVRETNPRPARKARAGEAVPGGVRRIAEFRPGGALSQRKSGDRP